MTEKTVRVGDMVAWANVPDGAMVRWLWDGHGNEFYWRRHAHVASRVCSHDGVWCKAGRDDGAFAPSETVTIVALGLTGRESAADLRRLAEVFEVREALWKTVDAYQAGWGDPWELAEVWLAERLHAAGWRPGMTAEDAARLLGEAGR